VIYGLPTTIPVTLDMMANHAAAVVRGSFHSVVVVDMPFGSYEQSPQQAFESATYLLKQSGAAAVKLEGGSEVCESVERIVNAGIPVMGHLGLTPQSIYKFGTYTVRAKEDAEAAKLMEDAKALEEAGCFSVVFEKIPAELAKQASESLNIPTIGIGAGADCDGQVLVLHDMLGITKDFSPRFLRRYAEIGDTVDAAVKRYVEDVRSVEFPNEEERY